MWRRSAERSGSGQSAQEIRRCLKCFDAILKRVRDDVDSFGVQAILTGVGPSPSLTSVTPRVPTGATISTSLSAFSVSVKWLYVSA